MKCRTILAMCMLFPGVFAWAQDGQAIPNTNLSTADPGVEMPYTSVLTPPMPITGWQKPPMFSSETSRSNFVMGGLRFDTGYDDNVLMTPSNPISDVGYLILPSIEIGLTRERWNLNLDYSLGFTINQQVAERNQTAQNLQVLFDYRLSPHVTAQIHESFEKGQQSVFQFAWRHIDCCTGPAAQPNPVVVTPLADRTANTTGLDLTYQFSASNLVGASGDFYFVTYNTPSDSTSQSNLINSSSSGGSAFFARQFSGRQWAGIVYNFQRLLSIRQSHECESDFVVLFHFHWIPRDTFGLGRSGARGECDPKCAGTRDWRHQFHEFAGALGRCRGSGLVMGGKADECSSRLPAPSQRRRRTGAGCESATC